MVLDKGVVCLFSGGVDSTTLLHHLLSSGAKVVALSFDYGQRHSRELRAAVEISAKLGVEHMVIKLPVWGQGSGVLVSSDEPVPHGHYEDANMVQTVVPNRNMVMLSVAVAVALGRGLGAVAIATHAGDHAIYPDCRPEFMDSMRVAIRLGNYKLVSIYAPYIYSSKAEIVAEGRRLRVDYSLTWSCYEGGETPCGKCGTCVERAEAMEAV